MALISAARAAAMKVSWLATPSTVTATSRTQPCASGATHTPAAGTANTRVPMKAK